MKFAMPAQLPTRLVELNGLREQAEAEIAVFRARVAADHEFSEQDVDRLRYLVDGEKAITAAMFTHIAEHEAGHAVMAVIGGGRVEKAVVFTRPRKGGGQTSFGRCDCSPFDLVVDQRRHHVLAAGVLAEAVAKHGRRPSVAQIEELLAGTEDHAELTRFARTSGGPVVPTETVLPLVLRCWPAIASLAGRMRGGGSITHDDVTAALGLSLDPAAHPYELAAIRSGLRSVPNSVS